MNLFQIVYLAPMKALAAEMADTFSKRLSPLGVRVRECTGDMQLSKQELLETQVGTFPVYLISFLILKKNCLIFVKACVNFMQPEFSCFQKLTILIF